MASSGSGLYLIVEDSPVFAALFTNTMRDVVGAEAEVIRCNSYDQAAAHLTQSDVRLMVTGYGVGDGKTAHDLRAISQVPMVVMTGRPGGVTAPPNATLLSKSAGPDKLRAAIAELLAATAR